MNEIAIRVEDLSKLYHIGPRERYKALRDSLTYVCAVSRAGDRRPPTEVCRLLSAVGGLLSDNSIWALKDVSVCRRTVGSLTCR